MISTVGLKSDLQNTIMDYRIFYRRHLPHYQPPGATLFVTFRLSGSLPKTVIQKLVDEADRKAAELAKICDPDHKKDAVISAQKVQFGKWDKALDNLMDSPRWLANPHIARIVCDAIHSYDRQLYELHAYCIMPNHVHLVITPLATGDEYISITWILKLLKGLTARKANQILNREGSFWQAEFYDHVIRDPDEFDRILGYVLDNPERAGLPADWTFRQEM